MTGGESTANRLLGLLRDIESAMTALAATPAVREIGEQVRSGGGFFSRPPGDLNLLDLLDERSDTAIVPAIRQRALQVRDERRATGTADDGPDDANLQALCRYLRPRVAFIVTRGWAGELEAEWSEIRGRLANAAGSPLFREVIARTGCLSVIHDVEGGRNCLGVVETRLLEVNGRPVVTSRCRACGRVYDEDALARARAEQDAEVNLVTAAEAVTRLARHGLVVTAEQIRKWGVRGSVTKRRMRGQERTYNLTELARQSRSAQRYHRK